MADEPAPYALVVIGSSAGGIEALSVLVASLRAGFPLPVVVAQHLDPSRASHLEEILSKHAALPVRTATARAKLEPGVIFLAPTNRLVEIQDEHMVIRPDGAHRPLPSVDLLFSSAARAYGERLIAVVLTGTGSDGATGAREVKQAGGTVIIQNPATAAFPGMPASLAPTIVDITANLEAIGSLLTDLVHGAALPVPSREDGTLASLLGELREQSGIDFSSYKMPTIMRRLQRRLVATSVENLQSYIHYLRSHHEEYQRLISSFLIKVTEFFRDPELYAYLRAQVLPDLIADARKHGNELRLWSAGCATGEEAYSLAIVVAEALGDELDHLTVRIFATDLDFDAVAFARRGIYPAAALANLAPELVVRYFNELDGGYEIKKRVRSLTVFGQHDLGQRAPFPRIDLVLCRNVLIYFTAELQKRALQLFAFSLRDNGYLVLGKSETTTPLADLFTMEQSQLRIYRRQGDRMLIPPTRIRETTPVRPREQISRGRAATALELDRVAREPHAASPSERLAALMLNLPVGVVLIDRRYDIQAINNAARRMLGIHTGAVGEDLIHLTRTVPLEWLRQAIDAVFRGSAQTGEDVVKIEDPAGGNTHYRIICVPHPLHEQHTPLETVMIVVIDVTDQLEARAGLEAALAGAREDVARGDREAARVAAAMQRLMETNQQLTAANEDLILANGELRGANEEFLVTNEEAQAASEEVETLNEELQATNEELETLIEELQATVEELNTTNDDLQARSTELQASAASLEEQRRESEAARERLEAILHGMGDAVLVVDQEARPVLSNRAYGELFGDAETPIAAEDAAGELLPPEQLPRRRAARLESFRMAFNVGAADGTRRWFEAYGQPVRGVGDANLGVVVIRDITEGSLRRLQERFVAMASHELRQPLTALQAALQQLQRTMPPAAERTSARHMADLALNQVHRLDLLTRDLTDLARLQTGKLRLERRPLDLAALIEHLIESLSLANDQRSIVMEAVDRPLMVEGDAMRLEQVVNNLLTNSITHAPLSPRIDVRLRRDGDQIRLEVQDYGPGIPTAIAARIFSPFFQVLHGEEHGGLGLGLHISKELIEAHGGSVEVSSAEGAGATFVVRLPAAPDGPGEPSGNAPA